MKSAILEAILEMDAVVPAFTGRAEMALDAALFSGLATADTLMASDVLEDEGQAAISNLLRAREEFDLKKDTTSQNAFRAAWECAKSVWWVGRPAFVEKSIDQYHTWETLQASFNFELAVFYGDVFPVVSKEWKVSYRDDTENLSIRQLPVWLKLSILFVNYGVYLKKNCGRENA